MYSCSTSLSQRKFALLWFDFYIDKACDLLVLIEKLLFPKTQYLPHHSKIYFCSQIIFEVIGKHTFLKDVSVCVLRLMLG